MGLKLLRVKRLDVHSTGARDPAIPRLLELSPIHSISRLLKRCSAWYLYVTNRIALHEHLFKHLRFHQRLFFRQPSCLSYCYFSSPNPIYSGFLNGSALCCFWDASFINYRNSSLMCMWFLRFGDVRSIKEHSKRERSLTLPPPRFDKWWSRNIVLLLIQKQ